MSKLEVRTGNTSNDKKGDPLRTAFTKVNMNFTSLFDFIAGTPDAQTLPVALPVSAGGTGASTTEGAHRALGLTEIVTKAVGTEEGNVMLVGTCGFGTDYSPRAIEAGELRTVESYKSGELECTTTDSNSYITLATRDSAQKYHLGVGYKDGVYTPKYRYSVGGKFSEWQTMLTSQNTIVTVNGNVKYSANSLKLRSGSAVDQYGSAVDVTRASVGVYTVKAEVDTSNWTLEVPMDYKGATAFDVVLNQVGESLKITVTKSGTAYDIPADQWIDIHIK